MDFSISLNLGNHAFIAICSLVAIIAYFDYRQ